MIYPICVSLHLLGVQQESVVIWAKTFLRWQFNEVRELPSDFKQIFLPRWQMHGSKDFSICFLRDALYKQQLIQ